MAAGRGLSSRRGALPAVLAGLIALGTVGAAFAVRAAAGDNGAPAETIAVAEAAAATATLRADALLLAAAGDRAADVAAHIASPAAAPRDARTAIGVLTPSNATFTPLATSVDPTVVALTGADINARPAWKLALDLARDGGKTVAAVAPTPAGTFLVMEVRALYADGRPAAIEDRRRQLEGYAVLIQPVRVILDSVPVPDRVALRLVDGDDVLDARGRAGRGGPSPSGRAASVQANGVSWAVQAWTPHASGPIGSVLAGGLLLALGVATLAMRSERERDRVTRAAIARADELGLVARMGPLLQQSLDAADLLPLFAVEVGDEFNLEDISISLLHGSGALVRAFSLGATTTVGNLEITLQRGGRVVGALHARARDELSPSQLDALRAVCDLLAAALGNVDLLRDEQKMVARLRDLDQLKATFLGSVSHELRTMVVAVEGFASLLVTQAATLDENRRTDFAQRIQRNARSLGALVDDLLDFARLESSGMSVTMQPVELSTLVPNLIDQMSSLLGKHVVTTNVAPGIVAMTDPTAIERILTNLLSNAAKYAPPGSEVTITLDQNTDDAVLCVADRGAGVAPAERERIFDLFYRIDNSDARAARGVGIGLALVRQMTELLRGTIAVDDAPGGGARFRLTVPLAADSPPELPRALAPERQEDAHVQAS